MIANLIFGLAFALGMFVSHLLYYGLKDDDWKKGAFIGVVSGALYLPVWMIFC
jgi:hypothetical protein